MSASLFLFKLSITLAIILLTISWVVGKFFENGIHNPVLNYIGASLLFGVISAALGSAISVVWGW